MTQRLVPRGTVQFCLLTVSLGTMSVSKQFSSLLVYPAYQTTNNAHTPR